MRNLFEINRSSDGPGFCFFPPLVQKPADPEGRFENYCMHNAKILEMSPTFVNVDHLGAVFYRQLLKGTKHVYSTPYINIYIIHSGRNHMKKSTRQLDGLGVHSAIGFH